VPYAEICKAAAIPAVLYFLSAFWIVHLEAGKFGLTGLPKDQVPSALGALRRDWFLLLPLAVLVYLLFAGYTPLFAGTVGLGLTALVVLGRPLSGLLRSMAMRLAFWVVLGVAAGGFFRLGITALLLVVAAMVAVCAAFRGGRETLALCRDSLADGARHALPVGVACALVGTIIGALTLTGAASTFAGYIVDVGRGSLFVSLLMTMVACLILGTGIPTIPSYIITASIAGPALAQLGVPLILSHMFVFYFGIMADLTPPVALAALAASPIAGAPHGAIGWEATPIALTGYVIPYFAIYAPALMLQPGDPFAAVVGFLPAVLYAVLKALLAIGLWGGAAVGYLLGPLSWPERAVAFVAAALTIAAAPLTDEAGFALAALFLGWRRWRNRQPVVGSA
jgi:TRAP transporter 4TM/12TM fusion protein